MKVVIVGNYLPDTNYSRDLSQGFIKIKASQDRLFLCGRKNEKVTDGKMPKVDQIWNRGPLFFVPITSYLLKRKPDIVHIQQEFKTFGGIISAFILPIFILFLRILGYRVVVTAHTVVSKNQLNSSFLESFGLKFNSLNVLLVKLFLDYSYRLIAAFSHGVTVHAPALRKRMIDEYSGNPNKIFVIEHGVREIGNLHKKTSSPLILKRFPSLSNKKIILVFGYFSPRKGYERLVESFQSLLNKEKNQWLMVLAGDVADEFKPYRLKIERLIKKLKVEEKVIITGFVNAKEIDELYRMSEVSVIPAAFSFNSSGALSLAIAYKKPLLVANVKPIADEIKANNLGLLFENNSRKSFAEQLNKIMLSSGEYQKIKKSIKKVSEKRAWTNIAKEHYNLYSELLKNK